MKWKADKRPATGLQIKYLRMILPAKQIENLIDRYVEAKIEHLGKIHPKKKSK